MPGLSLPYQFLYERLVPHTGMQSGPTPTIRDVPVSRRNCAKIVTWLVDGEPIEAILPASLTVNLNRLLALAGGREIRPATVDEVTRLFRRGDAEIMRSSARLLGQSIFVDVALISEPEIVFILDDGPDATYLRWDEFARSARPIVGKFAEPPLSWARCRLSPCE